MSPFTILSNYLKRTGQSAHEMLSALSNYEFPEIIKLIEQAERNRKKLIFYFESKDDKERNHYSYRFE